MPIYTVTKTQPQLDSGLKGVKSDYRYSVYSTFRSVLYFLYKITCCFYKKGENTQNLNTNDFASAISKCPRCGKWIDKEAEGSVTYAPDDGRVSMTNSLNKKSMNTHEGAQTSGETGLPITARPEMASGTGQSLMHKCSLTVGNCKVWNLTPQTL